MNKNQIIEKFLREYHHFYIGDMRNQHVEVDPIRLYTRKSHRFFRDKTYQFLDIGSINIASDSQKQGIFTALLEGLIKQYPTENIFIESIVNDAVRRVAERYGFVLQQQGDVQIGFDMFLIR